MDSGFVKFLIVFFFENFNVIFESIDFQDFLSRGVRRDNIFADFLYSTSKLTVLPKI